MSHAGHVSSGSRLVVDGMNVVGSRPDGWWRDREGAIRRLLARLQALRSEVDDEILLVLEGRPGLELAEGCQGGVSIVHATRRGPNAADDLIVETVRENDGRTTDVVVTSDRDLRRRVTELGATTMSAGELIRRLDELQR